jgi:hypothetical protein
MMPIVLRHAISGVAHINTEDPVLDDPLALAMLIDVFSERGYFAVVDIHRIDVPEHFDPRPARSDAPPRRSTGSKFGSKGRKSGRAETSGYQPLVWDRDAVTRAAAVQFCTVSAAMPTYNRR